MGRCSRGGHCQFQHQVGKSSFESAEVAKKLHAQTGECLETIDPAELSSVTGSNNKNVLTDYEFLASYNWVDTEAPTIYVPGKPMLPNVPAHSGELTVYQVPLQFGIPR